MGSVPYGDTGPWVKDIVVAGTSAEAVTFASQRQYGEGLELGTLQVKHGGKVVYSDRWPKGECWLPDVASPMGDGDRLILAGDPRTDPNLFLRGWGNGPKKRSWDGRIDGLHWGWYAVGVLAIAWSFVYAGVMP